MPRRVAIVAALTLAAYPAHRVSAQLALEVSAGARYTSALARDSIVTPFSVRPAVGPAVAVTLGAPLQRGWGAQVTVDFSTSEVQRHDAGGSSISLGRVSTAAFTVGVARRLPAGFSARVGVGGIKYFPGEDSGIFRLGSASIAGLGAVTLSYAPPLARRYHLAVEARYDVHGFTTPALRDEGFDAVRAVHRVALVICADGRRPR